MAGVGLSLTQQELERRLWDAANSLRGPVDPADFRTYVFPMLFWKWISDTWDYEQHQAVEEDGNDLTDEIESDFHQFVLPTETMSRKGTRKCVKIVARMRRLPWSSE